MAATPSQMLELGTELPRFTLVDTVTGKTVDSGALLGAPVVVAFVCNHCPYVIHIRAGLAEFGRYCLDHGARMVAISSNDVDKYPQDGPELMKQEAEAAGYPFPYLFDADQAAAKAFRAACTPDFYLFDAAGRLAYRGQFDSSRPSNGVPVTGGDLRTALDAVLAGEAPPAAQTPSIGCNIKWKPGNAPDYFG